MKECLNTLSRGEHLSEEQAAQAMHQMMRGEAGAEQIAGLLMGLRARGETLEELTAFTDVMREYAVSVTCDDPHAIDLCGTGGDGSGTFNISTAAALVCAGAGVTVAKHGNQGVSSPCGSADVMATLGVAIDLGPRGVEQCLREARIAFIFARRYHPAMRHVAPVRQALGVRTCFNILGPLCNPARVRRQVVGAFSIEAAKVMAGILGRLGSEHVLTLAAQDGLDEISLGATTDAYEHVAGAIHSRIILPEDHGFERQPLSRLKGGDAKENASIIRAIFAGKRGPHRDVVILNSAHGLLVSGRFSRIDAALAAARESIDSGAAKASLAKLCDVSQRQ